MKHSLIFLTSITLSASVYAATTASYAVTNTTPSTDGWLGDDLPNWVSATYNSERYMRNGNDGDDYIYLAQETGILSTDDQVTLTVNMRAQSNFIQVGLDDSGAINDTLFGMGMDFNNSGKYFIIFNNTRVEETTGTVSSTDEMREMKLVYDMNTGFAELFVDGVSKVTATNTGVAADLPNADYFIHRTSIRYTGASDFTVETVPEPSSSALLSLGALALVLRRKR